MDRASHKAIGLYWGMIAALLIFLAPLAPRAAAFMPPCLFRSLTGLPCPTCGATHAVVALSRLDPAGALGANPLVAIGVLAFLIAGLVAGGAALVDHPLREPRWSPPVRLTAILVVLFNWFWLIVAASGSAFVPKIQV
ncbi:MAG TPA: DUF2752 domain-containing protein [Thermoanaerobaculia bacterium]|nr:DUF2752 domain-containing protein [Thermoanaerobaculia bacterium]